MSTRILKGTGPTDIEKRFYVNGTQSDVGTVTVGITDDDGNVIEAAGAAVTKTGSGATTLYTYTLAVQATENTATITWAASTGTQTFTDRLRIVGGWLFTESELRAHYNADLSDAAVYTDALLAEVRDRLTLEFDTICNAAFVPTYRREVLAGSGGRVLEVDRPFISSVVAATIGTTAQTVGDLTPDESMPWIYHTTSFWNHATRSDPLNVAVSYVHGYVAVPPDIKRVAMILARMQLLKDVTGQGVPEIASAFTDATGTFTGFGANDMTGRWYGVPIVDATLRRYSMNLPLVSL